MAGVAKLLDGRIVNKSNETVNLNDKKYRGKIFALYFGAAWCEPCRVFTSLLNELYEEFHKEKKFKIIYVSSDIDERSFKDYCNGMPWLMLDYNAQKVRDELVTKFDIANLPKLVLIDGDSGQTICTNAREQILYLDPEGKNFPWRSTT